MEEPVKNFIIQHRPMACKFRHHEHHEPKLGSAAIAHPTALLSWPTQIDPKSK
jgi:hypothetical protein